MREQVGSALPSTADTRRSLPVSRQLFDAAQRLAEATAVEPAKAAGSGLAALLARYDDALRVADLGLDSSTDGWRWTFDPPVDPNAVARADGHLTVLLDAAAGDPSRSLDEVDIVVGGELATHAEWGNWADAEDWPTPLPATPTVIATIAAAHPDRLAIQAPDGDLSYGELLTRAGRLGAHLAAVGVRRGDLVGVALDRSSDLPVALLGAWRAGAAYVPIDPAYPAERVAHMLTDSACPVVITTADLAGRLPETGARVVCLDREASELDRPRPEPAPDPEDLAYVIYTSGSTGRPKGVEIQHRALANLLWSMAREPGLSGGDRLLAVTTPSFDMSVVELFLPLTVGATMVMASRAQAADPSALAAFVATQGITVMQATPATWRLLLDNGWSGGPRLRAFCGGEALPVDLGAAIRERVGELWNMYGPTETTVWSMRQRLDQVVAPVSIGQPIRETEIYVLDGRGRVAPVGVVGELFIGGTGVARGYRNLPEQTAERFLRLPVAGGRRLYRTGDLVRRHADGRLAFVGRADHQVKVRGFRIELGEVEAALRRDPAVGEAVVVVRGDDPGDRSLVAYVTARPGRQVTAAATRNSLLDVLPRYMVPAAVVVLPALPRTPNGKLDRAALPAPTAADSGRSAGPVAPRDQLEARLLGIWRDLLGIPDLGVTDDFFALGVSSLTAARLFAGIEAELGRRLPLAPVLQAPTVERLARLLREPAADRWSALVPIQPTGSRPPVFAVHGGAGTVLLYAELARRLGTDQPFYGLQAVGLYGREVPQTTVEEMAARYIREMRTVQPNGPYALAGYCAGGVIAFEMGQQLRRAGEAVRLVAMLNGTSPAYDTRHEPVADPDGQPPPTPSARLHRVWVNSASLSLGPRLGAVWDSGYRYVRIRLRRGWRRKRFTWAMAHGRPLADPLREGFLFQTLSMRALRRYHAEPADFPILVFRSAALYAEPDLGWSELTRAPVVDVEVHGQQQVPRDVMREPHVAVVAARLAGQLDLALTRQ